MNWTFFKDKAIAVGQFVAGDKTFTAAGSPYTKVWYVENKATFELNAVLNGTIVSENDVEMKNNNIQITATPKRMPAVVCGNSQTGSANDLIIKGLVYCVNDFISSGNNLTVLGAIIVGNSVDCSGFNKTITLDVSYTTDISGLGVPGELQIQSWKEL